MIRRLFIGMLALLCFTAPEVIAVAGSRQVNPQGKPHVFTVLVEFRNVRFSMEDPQAHFSRMLNGRLQDYFNDNSAGQFSPVFDVYGPVLLDAPMADYGKDILSAGERVGDEAPGRALYDACLQLDENVDFSRYDVDGDGIMDMILFYYAGYDQAEGGPSDAIWSHHQDIQNDPQLSGVFFDGVRLGYYFCTSELRGNEGTQARGIGSTVHEMGHALGLPDFYDTNGGEDGMAGGLYQFSPMGTGLYNDDGDTPPYFTAWERILLGWMEENTLTQMPEDGWMTLRPVQEQAAIVSRTATAGEFFLYECRNGTAWDAPLPPGLVVYHVDRSSRKLGGVPILTLWDEWRSYNNLNAWGSHPCYYVVPPMAPEDLNYAPSVNPGTLVFPGSGNVRCYEPKDWEARRTGLQITFIDFEEGEIRFRVMKREGGMVSGKILDVDGAPMSGVTLRLYQGDELIASDSSDQLGCFLLAVGDGYSGSLSLKADKPGYRPLTEEIDLKKQGLVCRYLQMFAYEDAASVRLSKFNPALSSGYFPSHQALIGAVRFSAWDLAPYVGGRISRVTAYPFVTDSQGIGPMYLVVDMGGERVLNQLVPEARPGEYLPVTVELMTTNLRIPEGLDIYVGYGFPEQGSHSPLAAVYPGTEGNSYYAPFSFSAQRWTPLYLDRAGFYMDIMLDAMVEEVPSGSLAEMGYSSISLRHGPYHAGDIVDLKVLTPAGAKIDHTAWTLDESPISGTTLTLEKGEHTLAVRLKYRDGREEVLSVYLKVD